LRKKSAKDHDTRTDSRQRKKAMKEGKKPRKFLFMLDLLMPVRRASLPETADIWRPKIGETPLDGRSDIVVFDGTHLKSAEK
jgi:hypothetical protein